MTCNPGSCYWRRSNFIPAHGTCVPSCCNATSGNSNKLSLTYTVLAEPQYKSEFSQSTRCAIAQERDALYDEVRFIRYKLPPF